MKREGRCGRRGCQRVVDRRCRGESKAVRADSTVGAVGSAASVKITRRLIPFMFVLYVVAFPDRINVGFADVLPPILPLRDAEQPAPGAHRGAGPDRADPDHLGDNLDGDIPRAGSGELPRPAVLLGVETCTERTSKAFLVWRTLPRVCPTAAMWPVPSWTISPGLTSNRQNYLTGGTCISECALTQGPRQPAAEGLTCRRQCVRRIDLATPSGARRQGPIGPRPSTLCWPLPSSGSGECQGGRRCSSSSEPGRIGCRCAPTCLPTGEA